MPIKARPVTPVKKVLDRSDPTGDTWVMIQPITYRHDMERGEYLKDHRMEIDGFDMSERVSVNRYRLYATELWLSYPDNAEIPCHIVLVSEETNEDGTKKEVMAEPFRPKSGMTQFEFMTALGALDPEVVLEWHQKMLEVNPDWGRPF